MAIKPLINLPKREVRHLLAYSLGGVSERRAGQMQKPMAETITKSMARNVFQAAITKDEKKVAAAIEPIFDSAFVHLGKLEREQAMAIAVKSMSAYTIKMAPFVQESKKINPSPIGSRIFLAASTFVLSAAVGGMVGIASPIAGAAIFAVGTLAALGFVREARMEKKSNSAPSELLSLSKMADAIVTAILNSRQPPIYSMGSARVQAQFSSAIRDLAWEAMMKSNSPAGKN